MTIHSDHPFLPPEGERSPLRRFRGRMIAPVSLWTAYVGARRVGWTVSSLLVADGPEPMLVGLLDPDADLTEALQPGDADGRTVAVSLLGGQHRHLPDAFAGLAPAPGGPFRLGEWRETPYGPVLADAPGWLGAQIAEPGTTLGWSTLVTARIEQVELGDSDADLLGHLRGRYFSIAP
ncbi:MAG: flavin reductase family protein [Microlunatus sp.]|nr:flavin reductase family protein [Microlunatus sp.]